MVETCKTRVTALNLYLIESIILSAISSSLMSNITKLKFLGLLCSGGPIATFHKRRNAKMLKSLQRNSNCIYSICILMDKVFSKYQQEGNVLRYLCPTMFQMFIRNNHQMCSFVQSKCP